MLGDDSDLLFYHKMYEDLGCQMAPSCLNCPLPQCIHDDPRWGRRNQQNQQREKDTPIMLALHNGVTVEDAAARFGIAVRTVYRAMARDKKYAQD
jgi:hypothetical protein